MEVVKMNVDKSTNMNYIVAANMTPAGYYVKFNNKMTDIYGKEIIIGDYNEIKIFGFTKIFSDFWKVYRELYRDRKEWEEIYGYGKWGNPAQDFFKNGLKRLEENFL